MLVGSPRSLPAVSLRSLLIDAADSSSSSSTGTISVRNVQQRLGRIAHHGRVRERRAQLLLVDRGDAAVELADRHRQLAARPTAGPRESSASRPSAPLAVDRAARAARRSSRSCRRPSVQPEPRRQAAAARPSSRSCRRRARPAEEEASSTAWCARAEVRSADSFAARRRRAEARSADSCAARRRRAEARSADSCAAPRRSRSHARRPTVDSTPDREPRPMAGSMPVHARHPSGGFDAGPRTAPDGGLDAGARTAPDGGLDAGARTAPDGGFDAGPRTGRRIQVRAARLSATWRVRPPSVPMAGSIPARRTEPVGDFARAAPVGPEGGFVIGPGTGLGRAGEFDPGTGGEPVGGFARAALVGPDGRIRRRRRRPDSSARADSIPVAAPHRSAHALRRSASSRARPEFRTRARPSSRRSCPRAPCAPRSPAAAAERCAASCDLPAAPVPGAASAAGGEAGAAGSAGSEPTVQPDARSAIRALVSSPSRRRERSSSGTGTQ